MRYSTLNIYSSELPPERPFYDSLDEECEKCGELVEDCACEDFDEDDEDFL